MADLVVGRPGASPALFRQPRARGAPCARGSDDRRCAQASQEGADRRRPAGRPCRRRHGYDLIEPIRSRGQTPIVSCRGRGGDARSTANASTPSSRSHSCRKTWPCSSPASRRHARPDRFGAWLSLHGAGARPRSTMRLRRYVFERSEEARAVRVGEKETSEQAQIVARYADLFSREQLEACVMQKRRAHGGARTLVSLAQDL